MPKGILVSTTRFRFDAVEKRIYILRSHRVMLDQDLAVLYGVETKALNRAVQRNPERFPADFMFQLTAEEMGNLRFHIGTSRWGGRRHLPYVFTQEGISMLSSVLRSKRAIQVNIVIMRAFVKLRQVLSTHKNLARKLEELEGKYNKHDVQIRTIFQALKQLIEAPLQTRRRIGFVRDE